MAFSCLSKQDCDKISAAVCEESSRREGDDKFSSAFSFRPAKLVDFLKFLALCPRDRTDKLDFLAIARAQLSGFNRWKGFYELSEFTMLGGLDGAFAEENLSKEKTDPVRDTEDLSCFPEENVRVSLRKRKQNLKYTEDDIVEDDVYEALKDFDGTTRISSRKRKPNSKYKEDEGMTQSWFMEEDVVGKENTRLLSQKRKVKLKNCKDGDEDHVEDVAGAHMSKKIRGFEGYKRVSSRKRKPNTKYSDDENEAHTGLVTENVVYFEGVDDLVSSPKRMLISNYRKDEGETHIGLEEDLVDAHGSKEISDLEGDKGVSLRKRNPNTKYKEKVEEEEDVDSLVSEEREDFEGIAKDDVWAPEGKNKQVSFRKQNPNTKYSEDCDYSYDEENENFQKSQKSYEKSKRIKLNPKEYPPPDCMLSQLCITAKDPMKGHTLLTSLIGFFSKYRNTLSQGPVTVIESNFEPETIERETNGAGCRDEKTNKDYTPTAVILFFVDVDSVPSKSDLHHVFGCYGDLNKANTEVVKRLRRARVVFNRRLDAENAFKGTGRFSIFGPSLVSYRLSYFYPE